MAEVTEWGTEGPLLGCGCRGSAHEQKRELHPAIMMPVKRELTERPSSRSLGGGAHGEIWPQIVATAHHRSGGSPSRPEWRGLASPPMGPNKGVTFEKNSPASSRASPRKCSSCDSVIDRSAEVCEMCGDKQDIGGRLLSSSSSELGPEVPQEPLTWYGRMGVRIRGRGGDVREICVPMPDKFVPEDASVLQWMTRPSVLPSEGCGNTPLRGRCR